MIPGRLVSCGLLPISATFTKNTHDQVKLKHTQTPQMSYLTSRGKQSLRIVTCNTKYLKAVSIPVI